MNKEGRKRIETFADYLKKVEGLMPAQNTTLFVVDNAAQTLGIYASGDSASGGSGVCDVVVDVTTQSDGHFVIDVNKFVQALKKVRSDDTTVKVDKNKVVVSGAAGDKNSVTLQTLPNLKPEEVVEISTYVTKGLASLPDPIEVKLDETNKAKLGAVLDMSSILDVNDNVEIGRSYVKGADNICVVSLKVPDESIVDVDGVLLNRNLSGVLKFMNVLKIGRDFKKQYVGSDSIGIRFLFSPKMPRWMFPSSAECEAIRPLDDKYRKFSFATPLFLESVEKFDGMFDSQSWKYKQVKVLTDDTDEAFLHYDDMACEVKEFLKTTSKEDVALSGEIEFILPTLHLAKAKALLGTEISFTTNDLELDDEHGQAVLIESGDVIMITAKLVPDES